MPSIATELHPGAPKDHPAIAIGKTGVLLVNLGTPSAPTPAAVRTYLQEFLSDRRIVDLPRAVWLPILHGVILNIRPAKTAAAYRSIWLDEPAESPLRRYTREQAEKLQGRLGGTVAVDWAMRYGAPSVKDRLNALAQSGCDRILVTPLYPQYSATTTASVHDAVFDAVRAMRWQPTLRFTPAYHDEPAYISALAAVTRRRLDALSWEPERVLLSFHGLPERYFLAGDPYHCHCQKTARLLRKAMGWSDTFAPIAFQSKFGREKWLEPATTDVLNDLSSAGVKQVAIVTPGFVSDCIETLEEIGIAAREQFEGGGGEAFDAVPCINAEKEAIDLLETLVRRELAGWIDG